MPMKRPCAGAVWKIRAALELRKIFEEISKFPRDLTWIIKWSKFDFHKNIKYTGVGTLIISPMKIATRVPGQKKRTSKIYHWLFFIQCLQARSSWKKDNYPHAFQATRCLHHISSSCRIAKSSCQPRFTHYKRSSKLRKTEAGTRTRWSGRANWILSASEQSFVCDVESQPALSSSRTHLEKHPYLVVAMAHKWCLRVCG